MRVHQNTETISAALAKARAKRVTRSSAPNPLRKRRLQKMRGEYKSSQLNVRAWEH